MLDLALHIVKTKAGRFQPEKFDDRYEAAVVELIQAKLAGRKITPPKPPAATKPSDLMEALRQSIGEPEKPNRQSAKKTTARSNPKRRKAA